MCCGHQFSDVYTANVQVMHLIHLYIICCISPRDKNKLSFAVKTTILTALQHEPTVSPCKLATKNKTLVKF